MLAVIAAITANADTLSKLPKAPTASEFPVDDPLLVMLGQKLFYDPILSGNKNISCGTCHNPLLGTSDGLSLGLGEGAIGLGSARRITETNINRQRIPRNAPALWNKGSDTFRALLHDGRVMIDPDERFGIKMPSGRELERPVNSLLAAQSLLPILSADEMAGHPGENNIGNAVNEERIHGPQGAWQLLADRVSGIPEYRILFEWLHGPDHALHITDITNAIGAFVAFEFRSTSSPFDAFLAGDENALSPAQVAGMELFYGSSGCSACHSGKYQTSQTFQSIGLPQIGPGKGQKGEDTTDKGRFLVTGEQDDTYKFLVPSLRNVTLTAPYGHDGAYPSLREILAHHLNPLERLMDYQISQARLFDVPQWRQNDRAVMDDINELVRIGAAIDVRLPSLSSNEHDNIIAFLGALEDPSAARGRLGVPDRVPSGLPVESIEDVSSISTWENAGLSEIDNEAPIAKVIASAAKMRSGPSTKDSAIAVLMHNYIVDLLDTSKVGWWKVSTHDGIEGFVASSLLERTEP